MDEWLSGLKDEVTKQMLLGVIEKKERWERFKQKVKMLQIVTSIGFILFFLYIIWEIAPLGGTVANVMTQFFGKVEHLYALLLLFTLYWAISFYKNKCEKAEEEFHLLRCEIIQKSAELWKNEEEWKERHKWFEMMKAKYDINLFYENS
ncbi:hypothetical protein GFC29_1519 [Anoxybacillus sp. B7M1]|nr:MULTISPECIES: DUF2663 family protein [unclassified Anoxybacillus]ANB57255.1 hypothetical protein GFC28_106 [Anoxybacillus sp. B2M1]ANB65283.1 hypothetical protein GFC29_1519 [Anoxybacillus sp. B7M1]